MQQGLRKESSHLSHFIHISTAHDS